MSFIVDKQTLNDLNIFGGRGKESIFNMFNVTCTQGGSQILEQMFRSPLSDERLINRRCSIISYFENKRVEFPFKGELFDVLMYYLSQTDSRTQLQIENNTLQRKLQGVMGTDADYEQYYKGVVASVEIITGLRDFILTTFPDRMTAPCGDELHEIICWLEDRELALLFEVKEKKKFSYTQIVALDTLLRFRVREKLQRILSWIYNLDVYIAIASVARQRNFVFAKALPGGDNHIEIVEMFHPQVKNAVSNSLIVDRNSNVLFLTGANMAGKSTFMKTLGTVMFLAHMGFPIPAKEMTFSVLEGMYTTINLPDNLSMGYSHFYSEVMRVKKVAQELGAAKNLLVIFDELFRGTNVKDAYDATIAITEGFARKRDCLFVISTHIIESGEVLKEHCDNIRFLYMPTVLEGNTPRYLYKLKEGITSDRHGMMIVKNENILNVLQQEKSSYSEVSETFIADKQTLEDLNIMDEFKSNSIFNVFNKTRTKGGKLFLKELFRNPLTEARKINDRVSVFRYFQERNLSFPVDNELFQSVNHYLGDGGNETMLTPFIQTGRRKLMSCIGGDKEYESIRDGVTATIIFLRKMKDFVRMLENEKVPSPYIRKVELWHKILDDKRLRWIYRIEENVLLKWYKIARYDYLLRVVMQNEMHDLMELFYEVDVLLSVTDVARERGYIYAHAYEPDVHGNEINVKQVYHPCIEHAIGNSICLNQDRNVLFLTGANMAGKSTLMKSFSIAVYLAHMGFPVAAKMMDFTVQEGMYTSINVSDNLVLGYSHFYAEVMRVKCVAEKVASGKRMFVVFDELFKGTNVKDAFDATVAVTEAFSNHHCCSYIISTHIIEAGHTLREQMNNLQFSYLPTEMKEGRPTYTYRLQEGVTDDRQGMIIINNERIVEILNQ